MCRRCGREVCNDCFQIVTELTRPDELTRAQRKSRERHARSNPSLLSCSRRSDPHGFADFTPVTRFGKSELNKAVEEMQYILDNEDNTELQSETMPPHGEGRTLTDYLNGPLPTSFPDPLTSPIYDDFTPANTPSNVISIPIHRTQIIPASYYDPSPPNCPRNVFSSLWVRGLPLLVKDVLPRFKLTWNPEYFIEKYGDVSCNIVECQTEVTRGVCIREFFTWFGNYENRTECWKLKVRIGFLIRHS
jgi:lysine-specific demethylase 3